MFPQLGPHGEGYPSPEPSFTYLSKSPVKELSPHAQTVLGEERLYNASITPGVDIRNQIGAIIPRR
jgi:hypothetical protein